MGLDLSARGAGVCVLSADGEVLYEDVFGIELPRNASLDVKTLRLLKISEWVIDVFNKYKPEEIGVEEYAYGTPNRNTVLSEINGCVRLQLYLAGFRGLRYVGVGMSRKIVLGRGNAPRGEKVKDFVERRLNEMNVSLKVDDDNVRDAFVIVEALRQIIIDPRKGIAKCRKKTKKKRRRSQKKKQLSLLT
ncbi:MAG: hypothetical protein DRO11_02435 [Methanobacteriota archaeon]|nr:MAG: hypothetical protein DRO11_02435 [Euryarchaeota archaeon]